MARYPTDAEIDLNQRAELVGEMFVQALSASRGFEADGTEPTNPKAYQFWVDTDHSGQDAVKQRDAGNAYWRILWLLSGFGAPFNGYWVKTSDADVDLTTSNEVNDNVQGVFAHGLTASRALTLPSADGNRERLMIVHRDHADDASYTYTLNRDGTDTIGGETSVTLEPGDTIVLLSEGETYDWRIVAERRAGVRALTGATTLSRLDKGFTGDATGGAFTVTLPNPSKVPGQTIPGIKTDASGNAVTVNVDGGANINGATTDSLASQYSAARYWSDGSQFWKV